MWCCMVSRYEAWFVYVGELRFCDSVVYVVFFFKQKTAYDMRISDWSSDVCSSDLSKSLSSSGSSDRDARICPSCIGRSIASAGNTLAELSLSSTGVPIALSVLADRKSTRLNSSH